MCCKLEITKAQSKEAAVGILEGSSRKLLLRSMFIACIKPYIMNVTDVSMSISYYRFAKIFKKTSLSINIKSCRDSISMLEKLSRFGVHVSFMRKQ